LFQENLGLKLFSLIMALFIWLQSVLITEQKGVINLPVVLRSVPRNLTLDNLPKTIPFNVRGKGLELIKLKLSKTRISLDAAKIKPGADIISLSDYTIDLPDNIHVNLIGPADRQDIAVHADVFNQKKVPVELSFADNYTRLRFATLSYKIIPDKLMIFGPKSKIQLIDHISTEEITRQQLSDKEFSLKIPEIDQDVSLPVNNVKIRISSSYPQTRVYDGLMVKAPAGKVCVPAEVTLKISGDSDILNELNPQNILISVSPEADANGFHQVLVEAPSALQVQAITPSRVRVK
jgi:hypothetical protein